MNKLLLLIPIAVFLAAAAPKPADPEIPADIQTLLDKNGCVACHHISRKLVGPMWTDVAAKKYSAKRIMQLVQKPEPNNWPGYVPMVAQTTVPKADLTKIANWLSKLK